MSKSALGVIFPGLLAKKEYVSSVYGVAMDDPAMTYGVFYGSNGRLLALRTTPRTQPGRGWGGVGVRKGRLGGFTGAPLPWGI